MDPTPFHHRNLDTDAEEFLETWALEFPQDSRFRIVVHIEQMPREDPAPLVAEAIHNYFNYKSVRSKRKLRLLLLEGRASLLIGLRGAEKANIPFLAALPGALRRCSSLVWLATRRSERLALYPASAPKTVY